MIGIVLLFLLTLLWGCATSQNESKILIALSKGVGSEHYERYGKWLEENSDKIICVDLYSLQTQEEVDDIMSIAAGLVLTGGPDVHPDKYGRKFDTARCEIDPKRDSLEFHLIKLAKEKKMPVLGICRGLQILNVAQGGTLFVDIPDDYGTDVIHRCDSVFCYHNVTIDTLSLLYNIMKERKLKVNSYHHQGINIIADNYVVNAHADDNFIEGIELKDKENKPFFLAVQWHPERLKSETSKRLARRFVNECLYFVNKK